MRKIALCLILTASSALTGLHGKTYTFNDFTLEVNPEDGTTTLVHQGDTLFAANRPYWGLDQQLQQAPLTSAMKSSVSDLTDAFGKAKRVTLTARQGDQTMTQHLDFYPQFVLTDLEISSNDPISLNTLAPIASTRPFSFDSRSGNYSLSVPYDNDAWVRYLCTPMGGGKARESYEVSAIFNADTRRGLVLGSIEHDTWKSGINLSSNSATVIDTLVLYSGASSELTRDKRSHGSLIGKKVRSARMALIPTQDWRQGMEDYADLCAIAAPKIAAPSGSEGCRPFGWNSWGKLQTKITYDKAVEVSDFIHDNLQNEGFHDAEGNVVIDLDAFWDFGFKPHQHKQFVEHCKANGQKPGIYYCPFTDWGKNPDVVIAELPEYKMGDLYLRVNGEPIYFDGAPALDPTHPATQARIRRQLEEFLDWGYEYVKIDFMAHGAYESDHHFDPVVTTGTQAYNVGMQFIDDVVDGRMWINLSIAPLFPANYAHSRRISCDSWSDIGNTAYTLNSLTYGWWLDHVYHNNDADHIVYEGVTDGENRARVTSSAITGVYFLGDDMSRGGLDDTKRRVVRNTTNKELNQMARDCGSFRPVEAANGEDPTDMFVNETPDYTYVAIFNYSDRPATKTLPLRRLGLSEAVEYPTLEIWSGDTTKVGHTLKAEVPAKDVKLYKFTKNVNQ